MNHLLVVQLARLGDLIQSKRLLLSLAAQPNTQVHLCVDASLAAFAAALFPFAHVLPLPAHATGGATPESVFTAARHTFAQLQEIPFSGVYTLNASPLSYAIARLFPPEVVCGYSCPNGQPLRHPWFELAARWTRHRLCSPLNLIDMWAHLHPAPIAPQSVNPVAAPAGQGRIGVVMAGRAQRRSLPVPVLAACVEALFRACNGPTIVCLGGKGEVPLARQFARQLSPHAQRKLEDTTGRTGLLDLMELLPTLDCLITPDTGLMHLATHLGVPVQAFFLSSAWCFETGPYGLGHTVWQATVPCAPCLETAPCHHNMACLVPFSQPEFLSHLAGTPAPQWPQGLTGYASALDDLGACYHPVHGADTGAQQRASRRALLAELCLHRLEPDAKGAEDLLHEADWMLP